MDWEESYLTIQVVFIIIPALIGTYLPSLSRFTITTHFYYSGHRLPLGDMRSALPLLILLLFPFIIIFFNHSSYQPLEIQAVLIVGETNDPTQTVQNSTTFTISAFPPAPANSAKNISKTFSSRKETSPSSLTPSFPSDI
jgi:hypothetical protein